MASPQHYSHCCIGQQGWKDTGGVPAKRKRNFPVRNLSIDDLVRFRGTMTSCEPQTATLFSGEGTFGILFIKNNAQVHLTKLHSYHLNINAILTVISASLGRSRQLPDHLESLLALMIGPKVKSWEKVDPES